MWSYKSRPLVRYSFSYVCITINTSKSGQFECFIEDSKNRGIYEIYICVCVWKTNLLGFNPLGITFLFMMEDLTFRHNLMWSAIKRDFQSTNVSEDVTWSCGETSDVSSKRQKEYFRDRKQLYTLLHPWKSYVLYYSSFI